MRFTVIFINNEGDDAEVVTLQWTNTADRRRKETILAFYTECKYHISYHIYILFTLSALVC